MYRKPLMIGNTAPFSLSGMTSVTLGGYGDNNTTWPPRAGTAWVIIPPKSKNPAIFVWPGSCLAYFTPGTFFCSERWAGHAGHAVGGGRGGKGVKPR